MIRYRLSELAANRRKGTVQTLPPIHGSLGAERAYLKALRAILRELARETRESIVPLAVAEIQANRAMTKDADRSWFRRLLELSIDLAISAEGMVGRILGLEAERHTKRFMETAKQALGVDLGAVVRQEDLGDLLRNAALKNAQLIKGLADDTAKRVSLTVMNAVTNGKSAKDLRAELTRQFGISDRRAQLIARNEISSFNSDMNRLRHVQAGITEYIWRSSADERVRPLHRSLEGRTYEYGKPTDAEEGLPPGKPIACRCIAQAVVTF